jgi:hypothetical protein
LIKVGSMEKSKTTADVKITEIDRREGRALIVRHVRASGILRSGLFKIAGLLVVAAGSTGLWLSSQGKNEDPVKREIIVSENDQNSRPAQPTIGLDIQSNGTAAAPSLGGEIINSGPGIGADISATVPPGGSVIGARITQSGPGTGLRVIQNGPGTGMRITVGN